MSTISTTDYAKSKGQTALFMASLAPSMHCQAPINKNPPWMNYSHYNLIQLFSGPLLYYLPS